MLQTAATTMHEDTPILSIAHFAVCPHTRSAAIRSAIVDLVDVADGPDPGDPEKLQRNVAVHAVEAAALAASEANMQCALVRTCVPKLSEKHRASLSKPCVSSLVKMHACASTQRERIVMCTPLAA